MTFSILARCEVTGQFGLAISSSSPAVAARCSHVKAGVGAVASQNITDPNLGPFLLAELEKGASAPSALVRAAQSHPNFEYRQLVVVDRDGIVAIHTGTKALGICGEARSLNCAAAGNILASDDVPENMVEAFLGAKGSLASRLLTALAAGLEAGGELGPVRSAGIKITDKLAWPLIDLRSDWSERPIDDIQKALKVYEPQADAYVQRALHPDRAPSFGVPGSE